VVLDLSMGRGRQVSYAFAQGGNHRFFLLAGPSNLVPQHPGFVVPSKLYSSFPHPFLHSQASIPFFLVVGLVGPRSFNPHTNKQSPRHEGGLLRSAIVDSDTTRIMFCLSQHTITITTSSSSS
jgi:hypothetical protein